MKTQPITPAQIEFGPAVSDPPRAPAFDDIYHPHVGALAQARHVFLQGNGLPGRWAGRADFVILETGFGLGNNFLATWQAWRQDPARCERLHFVSIERHPPSAADLARAHADSPLADLALQLLGAWPPLTPNLHGLDFEGGRIRLTLALGDVAMLLPALRLSADAAFLDGFAPARNPQMWQPRVLKAIGRLAAPQATAASWSVAREVRAGLSTAGFEVQRAHGIGGKREITLAQHRPRVSTRPRAAPVQGARSAVVVGAGLAGAAAAQALARLGLRVTVLERATEPAQQASGNPAGLFHGTVNGDDGTHARLFRAAALAAHIEYRLATSCAAVPGSTQGLLRLAGSDADLPALQALLQRQSLPAGYVQVLDSQAASQRAGTALPGPAWWYPGGGWLSPPDWVRHALTTPGIQTVYGADVQGLQRQDTCWTLLDAHGTALAQAPVVVLAQAEAIAPLLASSPALTGLPGWPLGRTRGQVTHWAGPHSTLRVPVAGDGYALPLPDGGLLCGATRQDDDTDPQVRQADHLQNLQRLQRLTGLQAPADSRLWRGRVGWRLQSADRLPVAGALPLWPMPAGQRLDQVRLLPRTPGLFVLTGLGARGLTLAPLMARLVAAQATGTPWPLEQDLADAVDPARWLVRQARAATRAPEAAQPG